MEKTKHNQQNNNSIWPWPGTIHTSWLACPHCNSEKGQWRGYRTTKTALLHRRRCNTCTKWSSKVIGGRL